ncbi:hypothetical protein PV325_007646 [Microctonus aethiopoides]|nr:hypothetical protein PV325_007646 [Microctonus aethiopoides]
MKPYEHLILRANNVELCDFLQKHALVGFYGFNELQVKDLLEKAGLGDNLEKVRDMYDGYETTLKNGLNIHLYSPWAVIKYLMTKQFSKYWSSGIPKRIEEALGNPKIATKIRKIMPGESEFFNHDLKLIKKFTNSGEALAKSCKNRRVDIKGYGRIKDKVRILAINIGTMFYNAKGRPRNEQEFQSALYIYLNLQFDYVACQCITRDDNVCDIIVVIENVMFVIECKNFYKSAVKAHDQIIVKGYFTLAETASLEYIFGDSMPTVQDIIRLGIHINRDCKTSIACLFADTKMKIINSR